MPYDPFKGTADASFAPATDCFAITPDDAAELTRATKALYVGTGGDVVVRPLAGTTDIRFRNVPSGGLLDIRVAAVRSTGTTAGDIVGLV
jgi:hypothetical protein